MLALLILFAGAAFAQAGEASGGLRGRVIDPSGAMLPGASVTATLADGSVAETTSDSLGNYSLRKLPAGTLSLSVSAPGFAPFTLPAVRIRAGKLLQLDVNLRIAVKQELVTVEGEQPGTALDLNPANNASTTVLKGDDLDALPDDPDELEQDLLALAGPAAGPNGGQIYVDGFTGGTLPPKSSIREIRINQNPFSAQYDRPGYGRVEIFTKPGTDRWHGRVMFNENNSALNSRNPYVQGPIPAYHSEIYRANLGGPLGRKTSLYLEAQQRNIHELGVVTHSALPPDGAAVTSPRTHTHLSARLDTQLGANNTLSARYQFKRTDEQNLGIGGIALPSQGYNAATTKHTLQISDTQVLSPRMINETRFEFVETEARQTASQSGSAVTVPGLFLAGGNRVGQSADTLRHYELQNYTSWAAGRHFVKFGGRMIVDRDSNSADTDFNGSFTFSSNADYQAGTPSQFAVVTGTPRVAVSYVNLGAYAEDDWRLRPNLTLSYGLRFETQSGISDKADFAPRLGLSWGLGRGQHPPRTVLRFGYGIFYDRFGYAEQEQAQRLNGITQQKTIYSASAANPILCPAGTTPPVSINPADCTFPAGSISPTIYQISPHLRAPYIMQTAASVERQLGRIGTASLTYLYSRGLHQLITRNANAPLAPGYTTRPLGGDQNIYQYSSEAIFNQHRLIASLQLRVSRRLSLVGYYTLNFAQSDTGGVNSNPSNSYNLKADYGRASFDIRHRLFLIGSASLAHNIRVSPFVLIESGAPFNITTGKDNNGDSFFNDRPGIVTAGCAANDPVPTAYGTFDRVPSACEAILPINYGNGPGRVTVNMRISKTFGFGRDLSKTGAGKEKKRQPERHHGRRGHGVPGLGRSGRHAIRGMFAPARTSRRFNLTLTVTARNLFNTWNPGPPIGSLATPQLVGQSTSLASGPYSSGTASRRVDFQAQFSF